MNKKKLNKAKEIDDFEFYLCDGLRIWRWREESIVRMKKGTFEFETIKGTYGSYYSKQDEKGKLFSKSKLWIMVRDYIKQCEKQGISKREMVEKTIEEFKYTPELKWNVSYKGYKG